MSKKRNTIMIPVSPAELMDKIAILEVKLRHIKDIEKHQNIKHELALLQDIFNDAISLSPKLGEFLNELRRLSAKGWDIEDKKRLYEKNKDFGSSFIGAARAAFKNNDKRAVLWKKINLFLGSDIVEEKSYVK